VKVGMNDMSARGFKVTERISNICINYANFVNFFLENTAELFQHKRL